MGAQYDVSAERPPGMGVEEMKHLKAAPLGRQQHLNWGLEARENNTRSRSQ